jgi:hypothetical protein
MSVGDLMAQEVELHAVHHDKTADDPYRLQNCIDDNDHGDYDEDDNCEATTVRVSTTNIHLAIQRFQTSVAIHEETELDSEPSLQPKRPKLSFRRYGTLSPNRKEIKEQAVEVQMEQAREQDYEDFEYDDSDAPLLYSNLQECLQIINQTMRTEVASLDWFRSSTMAAWAVAANTPINLILYKIFDRHLPSLVTKINPSVISRTLSIVSRVGLAFLTSIPANAAFFCYGSLVHHAAKHYSLVQEWRLEMNQLGLEDVVWLEVVREVPFDWQMAWSTARLKVETELWNTSKTAASFWMPLNTINFSIVPPHFRPLTALVGSSFWNCYMSLVQHRDAEL